MFVSETARRLVQDISRTLHDGVVIQREDGAIVWHNVVACRVLRMTSDQLLGRSSLDREWQSVHLDGSDYPGEHHPAMRCLRSGAPVSEDIFGVRVGDLTMRWLSVDATPVEIEGRPHCITVFTDVTSDLENRLALRATLDEMQSRLIQKVLPTTDRVRFAGSYRSVGLSDSVGGDFYGVYEIEADDHSFFIGDVCGHGIRSAGLSSLARNSLRSVAPYVSDPSAVLSRLHDIVHLERPDTFLTAVFGRLDLRGERPTVSVAVGGHPLPILIRDGEARTLGQAGLFIGMLPDSPRPLSTYEVCPGDRIVMYTDGVTDSVTPRLSEADLLERIPTNVPIEVVVDVLRRLGDTAGLDGSDDAAVLGFELVVGAEESS